MVFIGYTDKNADTVQDTPPVWINQDIEVVFLDGVPSTYDFNNDISDDALSILHYAITGTSLPAGCIFDQETGILSYDGTTASTTYTHTVIARDISGSNTSPVFNIEIVDQYQPADFYISLGTSFFDAGPAGFSVQPGQIIEVEGGTRNQLKIINVLGTSTNPITIRSGLATKVTMNSVTAQRVFEFVDCKYFVLDGSATSGQTYGFYIQSSLNTTQQTHWLRFGGLSSDFTVKNIEINGKYSTNDTRGIGISINDNTITKIDYPGVWRENIIIENCLVYDVDGEGMYIGPNYSLSGTPTNHLECRNIIIRNNTVHDCGRDCIELKSSLGINDEISEIYGNVCWSSGLRPRPRETQAGQGHTISIFEGIANIYNNYCNTSGESGIVVSMFNRPTQGEFGPYVCEIYNNVVYKTGQVTEVANKGNGISISVASGAANITATIYNNTIVDTNNNGNGINTSTDNAGTVAARDNIVVDIAGTNFANIDVEDNNLVGTVASQDFEGEFNPSTPRPEFYRLTSSSPGKSTAVGPAPTTDYEGTVRGDPASVGAFE